MDLSMPELDGVGATDRSPRRTRTPVIVLTSFSDTAGSRPPSARSRRDQLKDAAPDELLAAIRAAAAGDAPLDPRRCARPARPPPRPTSR